MTDLAEVGRGVVESRPFGAGESMPRPLASLHAELIAAAGAALLLVSLLLLPWFGVDESLGRFVPGAAASASEGAWHTLIFLRWVMLLAVVVALLPLLVRPAGRWVRVRSWVSALVAGIGGLTALLLGYRVLVNLPDPSRVVDQRAGAILGLLGALAISFGGIESMRAHAPRARGSEIRTGRREPSVPRATSLGSTP